eukprot:1273989-Prymnesium_polylepis.1
MTAVVDLAATASRHARLNLFVVAATGLAVAVVDRSARRAPRSPRARHSTLYARETARKRPRRRSAAVR